MLGETPIEEINLLDLCDKVEDEGSLLAFVAAMRDEFENVDDADDAEVFEWHNPNLESFLEAIVAYGLDVPKNQENPWKRMAQLLLAGKMYV